MKLKVLSTAMILATVPMSGAFAAALDRSGQSISAFLQPGNYAEAGFSILDPDVQGREAGTSDTRRSIDDMADDYIFPSAAIKVQVNDQFSFGLLYDQPFGAKAAYQGENDFVSAPGQDAVLQKSTLAALSANAQNQIREFMSSPAAATAIQGLMQQGLSQEAATQAVLAQASQPVIELQQGLANANANLGTGSTQVDVNTQNLALVLGFQPNKNINVYAGPVYQTVKGDVSLRGQAYSLFNGYDAHIKETGAWGWLAGAAYQIPEIALKASITYRSEIDHDVNINENLSVMDSLIDNAGVLATVLQTQVPGITAGAVAQQLTGIKNATGDTRVTTPQSVNLDFQSGIMENTVAFANVRWVNWKNFEIQPYKFGLLSNAIGSAVNRPNGFSLVSYSDDQWSVTTGVGRKLNDKWAGSVSLGWDSGAGNPVTTLGPTEGYWNLGLGVQYSPTENYFVAGGVKYFWLGDAQAQTGAQAGGNEYLAEFEDNNAVAYGLKLGYRF